MSEPDDPFHTVALRGWVTRLRAGDRAARDELLRACRGRLEALARRMLRGSPRVGRWVDADDVFQAAAVRLLRALETTDVADTRGFYNLAATVTRCELIDLARHFLGPRGVGANHASDPGGGAGPDQDPAAPADDADLDRWAALHEAVGRLPADEREAFGLAFYHGWTQDQIAGLAGVHVRTVRRQYRRAVALLTAALGGRYPAG
jgi:RNA polymerase sigma factor (sigma-70 family)